MKFTANSNLFKQQIKNILTILPDNPFMDNYSNIQLEIKEDNKEVVKIYAGNESYLVNVDFTGLIEREVHSAGRMVCDGKRFYEIISLFENGDEIHIELQDDTHIKIDNGSGSEYHIIPNLDDTEILSVKEMTNNRKFDIVKKIDAWQFRLGISRSMVAISKDIYNLALTGIILDFNENLHVQASDSRILAKYNAGVVTGSQDEKETFIIPKEVADFFATNITDDESIYIHYDDMKHEVLFTFNGDLEDNDFCLYSQLIIVNPPNFDVVIEKAKEANTRSVLFNRGLFLTALKKMNTASKEADTKNSRIQLKLQVKNSTMAISAGDAETNYYSEVTIPVEFVGFEDIENTSSQIHTDFMFDTKLLKSCISNLKHEENLVMKVGINSKAVLFQEDADNKFIELLMPIRL